MYIAQYLIILYDEMQPVCPVMPLLVCQPYNRDSVGILFV